LLREEENIQKQAATEFWVVASHNFSFSRLFGEDSHFDKYFSKVLKPPTRVVV